MIQPLNIKLILTTVIATFAVSVFIFSTANANEDPFAKSATATDLILAGHHGGGKGAAHKIKRMDTDGDGAVSKEEFMAHKEEKFNKKDENGDGVLTEDEMQNHCKLRKNKAPKEE